MTNSGAFHAFVSQGIGRVISVAAALVALLAYSFLQVGLYGALGPTAASEASAHLRLHAPWWAWALAAWAVVTVLGLLRTQHGLSPVSDRPTRSPMAIQRAILRPREWPGRCSAVALLWQPAVPGPRPGRWFR